MKKLGLCLSATLVIALTLPSLSAHAELKAELYAGLAGGYRPGAWTPVTVILSNDGTPIDGTLRVAFRDDGGAKGEYNKHVRLPTNSRKRVSLYPRPGGTVSRITISFIDTEENVLLEEEHPMLPLKNEHRIIGYVRGNASGNPGIRALARKRTRVLLLEPEELPDVAAGLDALDALILREPDPAALGPARVEALRQWISKGGTLVVAVGTRGGEISADPDFESLLPARVGAMETLSVSETGLTTADDDETSAQLPMVGLSLVRGNVVWGVGGRQVGIAGPYGNGRVAVLGFDPGSVKGAADTRKAILWERLLALPSPPERPNATGIGYYSGQQTNPRALILTHVGEMPPLKPPPMVLMIFLLALYVFAVGPGDYLLLKKLGKLQWTWFTYPATILIFSGAVYSYAKFSRSETVEVRGLAVVDLPALPPDAPAMARAVVGIYAPTGDDYHVSVTAPGAQVSNFTAEETSLAGMAWKLAKNQAWRATSDSSSASAVLPIPQWSFGAAEIVGVDEEPAQLTAQRVGAEVAVTHGGGDDVIALAVVHRGHVKIIQDDLRSGETKRIRMPSNADQALSTITIYDTSYGYNAPGKDQPETEVLRKALLRVAFAGNPPDVEISTATGGTKLVPRSRGTPFFQRPSSQRDKPIVLAVVRGAPFELDIGGQGDRGTHTVYRVPVQKSGRR